MGFGDSFGISASGLSAERFRMDVIADNIANANTTRTAAGGPYRREEVVLEPSGGTSSSFESVLNGFASPPSGGVQVAGVVKDPGPFQLVYDPTNPDAVNGYVQMPNVDVTTEMTDMLAASRAYEQNVTAFDTAKQMFTDALSIGK